MGNALLSGVTGLNVHQRMLDVAGANLANVNTTAFKSGRVTFSEMLSETLKDAGQPTTTVGGTNPVQVGSGVQLSTVDKNMSQGSLINTGQALDMAIEGSGFFVLSDGQQEVYTRVGSFAVDAQYYVVDPASGFRVQRIGSEGVSEGFQSAGNDNIRVPYDIALPAQGTTEVSYTGNLSPSDSTATTHILTSGIAYSDSATGTMASDSTLLKDLAQVTTALVDNDEIDITVTLRDGTTASDSLTITAATTDIGDLLAAINTLLAGDATATIENGEIRVTEAQTGYSEVDVELEMGTATGELTLPKYFKITSAGGEAAAATSIEVFDSMGVSHMLAASFVRSDSNTWDLVLTSISGDVDLGKRRIKDITFQADGVYGGTADDQEFKVTYAHDPTNERTLSILLGDGISQYGSTANSSTVAASGQDGYTSGYLSSMSVTREGVLTGVFTNGIRRDLAAMKLATFQNPAGLEALGNGYYLPSANSGSAVPTKAMSGGAGAVSGSTLERSNVDLAAEFVNLIQAQNGFQANARTIRIANEILRELSTLIR